MKTFEVSQTARIAAPAQQLYAIIADYRDGHPHILPNKAFFDLKVDQGGIGAGTQIHFKARMMGLTQTIESTIAEPEPGRVLEEAYPKSGMLTTFVVDPVDATHADVTIKTRIPGAWGPLGALKRALFTRTLLPIYVEELGKLADFARQGAASN